jgi:hypothetical protein
MHPRLTIVMGILLMSSASASQKVVTGRVTYIASGTIYTSLGRQSGVKDSTVVYVTENSDTLSVLKVFAVSSTSSACRVVSTRRPIKVGSDVLASVVEEEPAAAVDTTRPSPGTSETTSLSLNTPRGSKKELNERSFVEIQGRVSAQYYGRFYQTPTANTAQPGVVLNLRASARDVPLKFELYSNLRTLSFGSASPFSGNAINQSRIYRLSLEYDDGIHTASVGRIVPSFIPSAGYIDGVLLSQRVGGFVVGTMLGYQPDASLKEVQTNFKKVALFTQYIVPGPAGFMVSSAYSRTYFHSGLDREVISAQVNAFSLTDVFVYANSEVDLRKKSGDQLILSPSLTSLFVNVNYRVARALTVGIGGDASRPVFVFSSIRSIPDSLLERNLRGGMNLSVSLFLPGGLSVSNTFTPRTSKGTFGQDYSNNSSAGLADVLSTGVGVRSYVNVNSNDYTNSFGYGLNIQRHFIDLLDLTLRFQEYRYTIKQISQRDRSRTFGADLLVSLTRALGLLASYDRLLGYGADSHTLFAELTVRF